MAKFDLGKGNKEVDTSSPTPEPSEPAPEPAAPAGMGSTIKKVVVVLVIAVAAIGGSIKKFFSGGPKAEVVCSAVDDGIRCDVKHTKGDKANVCWNVSIGCANGKTVTGNGCQVVEPEATETVTVPELKLTGLDACDKPSTFAVADVKVTKAE